MKQNWNILACCLNWKVIVGVVLTAGGLFLLAPNLAPAAIPVLLVAICPLSMLVMMWSMRGGQGMPGETARERRVGRISAEEEEALRARIARVQEENEIIARELARSAKRAEVGDMAPVTVARAARRD
jgi:hypothetical protein